MPLIDMRGGHESADFVAQMLAKEISTILEAFEVAKAASRRSPEPVIYAGRRQVDTALAKGAKRV